MGVATVFRLLHPCPQSSRKPIEIYYDHSKAISDITSANCPMDGKLTANSLVHFYGSGYASAGNRFAKQALQIMASIKLSNSNKLFKHLEISKFS